MSGPGDARLPARASGTRVAVQVVLVADPGPLRSGLIRVLEADGDITVTGCATDAADAVRRIEATKPDVVAIDLPDELCRPAVEQIMSTAPSPLIVFSSGPCPGSPPAADLIAAGALLTIERPTHWTSAAEADARRKVRLVRGVTVVRRPRRAAAGAAPSSGRPRVAGKIQPVRLVAIAASTGGPAALATVLAGLAGIAAPVLVVQHIHADFVEGLATWMDRVSPIPARLARDGELVDPGVIYIAPGNVHLKIGAGLRIVLDADPPMQHRPSANQLFLSVARHVGAGAVGVVLTGMGDDGAEGLLAIRQQGGFTVAQDEASSAVFGMPHAAQLAGAATRLLPVQEIAAAVVAATVGRRG